jgi:hypothetical protein
MCGMQVFVDFEPRGEAVETVLSPVHFHCPDKEIKLKVEEIHRVLVSSSEDILSNTVLLLLCMFACVFMRHNWRQYCVQSFED